MIVSYNVSMNTKKEDLIMKLRQVNFNEIGRGYMGLAVFVLEDEKDTIGKQIAGGLVGETVKQLGSLNVADYDVVTENAFFDEYVLRIRKPEDK